MRKSRAGGPPLWRIVLTCDIRRHLGHLPGRVSAIEGVCRSVFGTVQHTVRHKRAEPSFVKKLAINTASVHHKFCHKQNPRCPPSVGVNYPYTLRHIVNDVTCNGSILLYCAYGAWWTVAHPVQVSKLFCKRDIHVQHFETRQKSRAQTLPRTPLDLRATPAVKHVKPSILISATLI